MVAPSHSGTGNEAELFFPCLAYHPSVVFVRRELRHAARIFGDVAHAELDHPRVVFSQPQGSFGGHRRAERSIELAVIESVAAVD